MTLVTVDCLDGVIDQAEKFTLGRITKTHLACYLQRKCGLNLEPFLERHKCGDWGNLSESEKSVMQERFELSLSVNSEYLLKGYEEEDLVLEVWTEGDRSNTTVTVTGFCGQAL